MKKTIFFLLVIFSVVEMQALISGCAQIVSPTGGPRDSLPPKLINANPKSGSVNFKGNHITLDFNEYVEVQELRENLLVSPTPKKEILT